MAEMPYNSNMGEREFLIFLDPETRLCRYRHFHVSDGKEIVEFRIQLEILIDDTWYPVIRYDTAHGKAHKDWFEGYSVAEVLTIGQKDIMENWKKYRAEFMKEMKK